MPNIKSAKKRVLITDKKTAQNKALKSELNTSIRKFRETVAANPEQAEKVYSETTSVIDSAVSHGIIHKNNADRKKSRLAKLKNNAKVAE